MRIALLADPIDNQNAGVHVYTREMVQALIRNNAGHELILIREKTDPELYGVRQIAIPNIRLPIGFASIRLFFIVPLVLRALNVDVVIEPAHFGPFNLPGSVRRATVIHDLTPLLFPKLHRWHSQVLQKLFLKRILNHADLIITNSENTSRDVCNVFPDNCKKVKRIYPGISSTYSATKTKPQSIPPAFSKNYFLSAGTIEPRKNLIVLLEAFTLFKSNTSSDTGLVICGGKGWKADSFFEALASHPYRNEIALTGYVPEQELQSLYSNALATIYPSLYEGFGFPVAESLSCGIPVITSDNSSLSEAGGAGALYFNAADTQALSDLMLKIVQQPELRNRLSEKGLQHVKQFNWDQFGKELLTKLEQLQSTKD
ncbi:MAG TPA: glycosyltransferase family 1 protein [Bacteroidia bacterium]|nr:glycosyltransferase family 1 protein [Bacteroidia bacterium]